MAIAFDASTNPTYVNAATHTFSHTCTGSDGILWVLCWRRSGTAVSGVTYNGVSMTSLGTEILAGTGSGNQYLTMWYLGAPATGANNVVVTSSSGATEHIDGAVSYTGASATGIPDATNSLTATTQANTTATVTSSADNCWALMFMRVDAATSVTAGASTTRRAYTVNFTASFDTNTAKTPAGTITVNTTHSSASVGWWMASFKPVGAASTQISSINGVAQASISSFNGVALASIASAMGVANS